MMSEKAMGDVIPTTTYQVSFLSFKKMTKIF